MTFDELTVDDKVSFVEKILDRCMFFRKAQVFPLSSGYDFEGWLSNFSDVADRFIAAKILAGFVYFPKMIVERMLYDAVGNANCKIAEMRGVRDPDFYKENIYFSFVPGEHPESTDSGYVFLRMLKEKLNIPSKRIIDFRELGHKIRVEGKGHELNIVLCDDIVGSGNQCVNALMSSELCGEPIYECAERCHHILSYVPLVANTSGVEYIKHQVPNLHLWPVHTIGDEYDLFSEKCICWGGDPKLYKAGIEMIRRKSAEIGLLEDGGVASVRGFNNQGLIVAFEHCIPDAAPAIFFTTNHGWKPLKRRNDGR